MIFHAVISILLIGLVLLQFGKGAEAGLFSGTSSSDTVFTSGQQGNILSKATIFLSIIFLCNCIYLAKIQSDHYAKSLLDKETVLVKPLSSDKKINP